MINCRIKDRKVMKSQTINFFDDKEERFSKK